MTYGHLPRGAPWPRGPRPQVQKWCASQSWALTGHSPWRVEIWQDKSLPCSILNLSPAAEKQQALDWEHSEGKGSNSGRGGQTGVRPSAQVCVHYGTAVPQSPGRFCSPALPSLSCGRRVERAPFCHVANRGHRGGGPQSPPHPSLVPGHHGSPTVTRFRTWEGRTACPGPRASFSGH